MESDITREVRAARAAFAASHGYDLAAMVAALRQLDAAGDRTVVNFGPRPATDVEVKPRPKQGEPEPAAPATV
jgi:hypothetical protein